MKAPRTFLQAVGYFSDDDTFLKFLIELRWPNSITCPRCGSKEVTFLANARLWKCKTPHPKQKFSVKVETIFEDSPIGLEKWFLAMWLVANCKSGISSYELHRFLSVTQKTAWFMLQRIRLAIQDGSIESFLAASTGTTRTLAERRKTCTRTNDFKRERECPDPRAFERFEKLAKKVVCVPKAEIDRRAKKWRERLELKP